MTISKRIAAVVAAIVLGLGGLLVVASPASAAPPGSCANNSVCGYVKQQFSTEQGYEFVTGGAGTCQNVGLPNSWTSVFNNTGRTIRLYKGNNCSDGVWTLTNGGSLRNMGLYQPSWNDNIQSVRMS